jgi:phage tail-like protein
MPALNQPFTNARFRIEIDGLQGTSAFEVIFPPARIVERARTQRATEFGALILRRGLTQSSEWYEWWNAARGSNRARARSVIVVLLDESDRDAVRWTYEGAQPVAYQTSGLHTLGNEPLIETLELKVATFEAAFR